MNEERKEIFTYRAEEIQSYFSVGYLLALEQRIIASMISFNSNYREILSQIHEDDFTFYDHQVLFGYLKKYDYDLIRELRISELARQSLMNVFEKIRSVVSLQTMIEAIIADPSDELDADIEEFLMFSNAKTTAFQEYKDEEEKRKIYLQVVNKFGEFIALYYNDRLYEIRMNNYKGLPSEFCDTYLETFEHLIPLIEDGENNPSSLIPGENLSFDGMWVIIQKDIRSIEARE